MTKPMLDEKGVVLACARCGQKNRIPFARMAETGTCGQCQADLPAPAAPLEIAGEAQWNALVMASPLPIIVDFWAPWCGPCRMVAPELEKVAAAHGGDWLVVKINTEALPGLGGRFSIRSIPTMAVFSKGHEVTRMAGARPAPAIEAWVRESVGATAGRP